VSTTETLGADLLQLGAKCGGPFGRVNRQYAQSGVGLNRPQHRLAISGAENGARNRALRNLHPRSPAHLGVLLLRAAAPRM